MANIHSFFTLYADFIQHFCGASEYSYIIGDEINIKAVHFQESVGEAVQYEIKVNFPTAGPKLGKQVGVVQKASYLVKKTI